MKPRTEIQWRRDYHLRSMLSHKMNTLAQIKYNGNKKGWIYSPFFSGFSWAISEVKTRELARRRCIRARHTTYRYKIGILKFPDESEWTLYRYPPRSDEIPIYYKDLIKHIKIK